MTNSHVYEKELNKEGVRLSSWRFGWASYGAAFRVLLRDFGSIGEPKHFSEAVAAVEAWGGHR